MSGGRHHSIHQARAAFPRGLRQPENGFRFSLDSLLLACFVQVRPGERILDLGTGCGVIGLGLCLLYPEHALQVWGLDVDAAMVQAAEENARRLGLAHVFKARCLDLRSHREWTELGAETVDQVVCNPPYRRLEQGRQSPKRTKDRACFELQAGLEDFLRAAAYWVSNKGRVHVVYLAERLPCLLAGMGAVKLEPKRMRMVHSSHAARASLVLISGRKNAKPGLMVEPPLVLSRHSEVESFCPWAARE